MSIQDWFIKFIPNRHTFQSCSKCRKKKKIFSKKHNIFFRKHDILYFAKCTWKCSIITYCKTYFLSDTRISGCGARDKSKRARKVAKRKVIASGWRNEVHVFRIHNRYRASRSTVSSCPVQLSCLVRIRRGATQKFASKWTESKRPSFRAAGIPTSSSSQVTKTELKQRGERERGKG